MSYLDLIARHYSLRTTDTIVHPTVDIPSTRSTRFKDGEGMNWMFLQLSRYSTDFGRGAAGIVGGSKPIEKGVSGDREDRDGNKGEIIEEALFEHLKQHCASPKWSINLEFDISRTLDAPKPTSEQEEAHFLHRIVSLKPDATMDKVEGMFLDLTNAVSEKGGASNKADLGVPGGLEEWEIRDGKAWFAGRFPSRAALVEHEEVWMVIKKGQGKRPNGAMDDEEVCGYITTLADPERKEEVRPEENNGSRTYISSLFVYSGYRRKGLGRMLLQHVIARAKSLPEGPALVCLTVFCDNAGAREMYLAEGFVVTRKLWVIRAGGMDS